MRIAVVVEGGLVETLQATPLMRTLAADPTTELVLACPPLATTLVPGLPGVREVVPLRLLARRRHSLSDVVGALIELRRRRLHAAVLCTTSNAVRMAAYLAGIPVRVGPSGGPTTRLLSEYVRLRQNENRAAGWLRLADALDVDGELHAPAFDPGPAATLSADRLLEGTAERAFLVAMAPGTSLAETPEGAADRWGPERYAHLANQLARRHGAITVLLGTPDDLPDIEAMRLDLDAPSLDLSDRLSVAETAAVLRRCRLMIGSESPLLHLAAAVGTPAIGLFGHASGRRRGPYGPEHRVCQGLVNRVRGTQPAPIERNRVDDVLAAIEAPL
jgi:heptosyltransferase-2